MGVGAHVALFWTLIQNRIVMKRLLILLSAVCFYGTSLKGQLGAIDAGFTIGQGVEGTYRRVEKVLQQPDGKLLVGGWFTSFDGSQAMYLVRLNTNGTRDTQFNSAIEQSFSGLVNDFVLQPDGKIVVGGFFTTVGGQTRNNIARLNADGSLDDTFNPLSGFSHEVTALALQSDGKVLVGGLFTTFDFVFGGSQVSRQGIARLNADGSLDTGFNPGTGLGGSTGIGQRQVHEVIVQPDGKVLVAGHFSIFNGDSRVLMVRLNSDGTLDPSFDASENFSMALGGFYGQVYDMELLSDGKMLIAGNFYGDAQGLARLNADGSYDDSFAVTTAPSDYRVFALAVQPDGKILSSELNFGSPEEVTAIRRYTANGSLDEIFPAKLLNELATTIEVQQDGNIVIGGWFSYNPSGLMRLIGDSPSPVGISSLAAQANSLQMFPNPSRGLVQLSGLPQNAEVRVFDASGRMVLNSTAKAETQSLNLSMLPAGLYTILVWQGDFQRSGRLVLE